ncbi:MAG: adenylate/guanylate cyclase domain-containing protein [Actinomycetes bacterium]
MPDLPQGTVTFAFTDIEGSTSLLKQLGDEYADVLTSHRQMVREVFGSSHGVEIDTQGDAFFYAFPRARDAVAAAATVQRAHAQYGWPGGVAVRVRIGLHTGEPTLTDEGYVGLDVVRAARLCGSCRGGQVLLSQVTKALVGPGLPEGVAVFPVGERELKDIDEPEVVYELAITGVSATPEPKVARTAPQGRSESPDRAASFESQMEDWGKRMDEWGTQLESYMEQQVGESPEKSPEGTVDVTHRIRAQIAALFAENRSEPRADD